VQQNENLLHIDKGQQIDVVYMGCRQTRAVYIRQSGLLDVHQTGRRSDPGFESVLTLVFEYYYLRIENFLSCSELIDWPSEVRSKLKL